MTKKKLVEGLEEIMFNKAGWTDKEVIDYLRVNLKSLCEIDEEKINKLVKSAGDYSHNKSSVKTLQLYDKGIKYLASIVLKVNPIKFKEG